MREAKLLIVAENLAKAVIKDAQGDLGGFDAAVKKVGDTLKTALTATAVIALGKEIGQFATDAVQAFGEVDRTMTQLRVAVGGSESSFFAMSNLIEDMADKTLDSKDAVQKLVAELGSLGRSDSDIETITRASVALANVADKSLKESFEMVNATFTGTARSLEKLVPEIGDLTKEQLAAGDAVDLLLEKFEGISNSMSTGISQQFSNLKKTTDDLKEAIGANLEPTFSPLISWIDSVAQGWNTSLSAMANYHKAQKEFSVAAQTDALRSLEAELEIETRKRKIAQQNLDRKINSGVQLTPNDYLEVSGLDEDIQNTTNRMNEVSARLRALSSTLPSFALTPLGGGGQRGGTTTGSTAGSVNPGEPVDYAERIAQIARNDALAAADRIAKAMADMVEPGETVDYEARKAQIRWNDELAAADRAAADPNYGYESRSPGVSGLTSNSLNPFAGLLEMVDQFVGGFGDMFASLSSVNAILNPLQTILTGLFEVIGPLLNEALAPLVGILKVIGNIMGQLLAPVIEFLGTVISKVAEGFIWVINKIIDGINYIKFWGDDIAHVSIEGVTKMGDTSSTSTSTGQAAAYTGARNITFNFYNQGNVVGSGGLEELAELIASYIKREERYA